MSENKDIVDCSPIEAAARYNELLKITHKVADAYCALKTEYKELEEFATLANEYNMEVVRQYIELSEQYNKLVEVADTTTTSLENTNKILKECMHTIAREQFISPVRF